MSLQVVFEDYVLILTLNQAYTVETISEVMSLVESKERLKHIKHVIIDCSKLEDLDNFGGEIFLLKKNFNLKSFLFCGLKTLLEPVMNFFSQKWFQDNIVNYATRQEAMTFIKNSSG
jgi:hypothetical protein